jgi:hypothetical protein
LLAWWGLLGELRLALLKTPDRQEGRRKLLEDEVFGMFDETFGNDLGIERVGKDLGPVLERAAKG